MKPSDYVIRPYAHEPYDYIVFGTGNVSAFTYREEIESILSKQEKPVKVVFDSWTWAGDAPDRYVSVDLINGKFDSKTFKILKPTDELQETSLEFYGLGLGANTDIGTIEAYSN